MKITFAEQSYICTKAVRTGKNATLYQEDGGTVELIGVSDWGAITIEGGTWTDLDAKTLEQLQEARQEENKAALAAWLAEHPLTWIDGNLYGVTEEDQNEMSLNLQQYQVQVSAGREVPLEWHTQKKQCHTFTIEQYSALLLTIIDYVYPYRRYQEAVKEAIYSAQTAEEVAAVVIDYASVEAGA